MSLLSWNCRGMGGHLGSRKMQHLQRLIYSTNAKVIFISETKSSKVTASDLIHHFHVANSHVVPADQASGGLWLMWDEDMDLTIVQSSVNYILAYGVYKNSGPIFNLLCIYGDPSHRATSAMWSEISSFVVHSSHRPTFCMGDLNEIMHANEKYGLAPPNQNRINIFKHHVNNLGLMDMGYNGPAYTWSNKQQGKDLVLERLDRCLANVEWCFNYPNTTVYHLPMLYSDHAPIIAILNPKNRRPKRSFMFENWWLLEPDFNQHAHSAWLQSVNCHFQRRTTLLARSLTSWSKKKKPLQQQLDQLEEDLLKIQSSPDREHLYFEEKRIVQQHDITMQKLADYHKQRSKKHWVQKGDRNTSFFQKATQKRRRKNRISSVIHNNSIINDPDEIATVFTSYFENLFQSSNTDDATPSMDQNDNDVIFPPPEIPSENDILEILKQMRRDASPGPDGLNVAFYRAAWNWIKDDVTAMVGSFYETGKLQSGMNATNIVLVPKNSNPKSPADFRPISLCNVSYKIIAKSLANYIQNKLPNLICDTQQAFVKGRRISNNIVLAQQIAHSFNLTSFNQKAFLLKIDLSKAFDRIEWRFIADALCRKGFHANFVRLVLSCINSANFSVVINGQSYGYFSAHRGIRQGCPLSPYLFVLAINELSDQLADAIQRNHISGIKLGQNDPSIHSLMFADDLIIVGQAQQEEVRKTSEIINSFCLRSGQTPNWGKSSILFSKSTPEEVRQNILTIFPVSLMNSSTKHLGHPLLVSAKDRNAAYSFIVDKFKSKLTTYKANSLSHAGRLALIKSVFASIPIYYMSIMLFSKKLIAKLTAIIRKFWWTGIQADGGKKGMALRSWKDICKPVSEGGLGIRDLMAVNKSILVQSA